MRRVKAQLLQGTRPSKKETSIKNIKRYLNKVTIARDGLLIVRRANPLCPTQETIVVPKGVLDGLLVALHVKLEHPPANELSSVFERYFFALDTKKHISAVSDHCHTCASLKKVPHSMIPQSSSEPPAAIGIQFAADIIKRARQLILVIREVVSSYTTTSLIDSEQHNDIRSALIKNTVKLIPLDGPLAVIRVDPAPGFRALVNDPLLRKHRIQLEIGRIKNVNKNPVAERAVQEVEEMLLRLQPTNTLVNDLALAIATSTLNSKVRSNGLSSREVMFQRDQFTLMQLPITDHQIIMEKHKKAQVNNDDSARSKASGRPQLPDANVKVGSLVYLYADRDKHHARERYLVASIDGEWCLIRKFTGSQLRSFTYKVKKSEIYCVPDEIDSAKLMPQVDNEEEEPTKFSSDSKPAALEHSTTPNSGDFQEADGISIIPPEISTPLSVDRPLTDSGSTESHNDVQESDEDTLITAPSVEDTDTSHEPVTALRRSKRERREPARFRDYSQ